MPQTVFFFSLLFLSERGITAGLSKKSPAAGGRHRVFYGFLLSKMMAQNPPFVNTIAPW
jgi:hypothetical protein